MVQNCIVYQLHHSAGGNVKAKWDGLIYYLIRYSLLCWGLLSMTTFASAQDALENNMSPEMNYPAQVTIHPRGDSSGASVRISVPPFRGLEPTLTLDHTGDTYSDEFIGVGWKLSGFSKIERRGAAGGPPNFHRYTDRILLDGEEIGLSGIKNDGSYKKNILGGNFRHRFRTSYERIFYDEDKDTWQVWTTNGIKRAYIPLVTIFRGGQRYTTMWGVAKVSNPVHFKNQTNYTWFCDQETPQGPILACYPEAIHYSGVSIWFHRTTRPDGSKLYATGGETLGQNRYLLDAIEIQVGDVPGPNDGSARGTVQTRAEYQLDYATSTVTQRPLLSSVHLSGKNGEEQLRLLSIEYPATDPKAGLWFAPSLESANPKTGAILAGDFDGNGFADLAYTQAHSKYIHLLLSTGDVFGERKELATWNIGYATSFGVDYQRSSGRNRVLVAYLDHWWAHRLNHNGTQQNQKIVENLPQFANVFPGSGGYLYVREGKYMLKNKEVADYETVPRHRESVPPLYWVRYVDVTGDYHDDIVYTTDTKIWTVIPSRGTSFGEPEIWLDASHPAVASRPLAPGRFVLDSGPQWRRPR